MSYLDVKYKKFTSQRRFGVELETSNTLTKSKVKTILKGLSDHSSLVTKYQLSTENKYWHVKDDATCGPQGRMGPKGVEIASFVGKGMNDLQHIAEVAEGLYKAGSRTNENCGLHIHAEAIDISPEQLGVILAHWIKIESILSMSMPLSRYENPYCRKWSEIILLGLGGDNDIRNLSWPSLNLWNLLRPANLNYYENEDRRVTLNLVNYARADFHKTNHRKTIELRWPEGTLNSRDIKCWVRLFLNFIDICKDRPMPNNLLHANLDETLTYLGLNHDENFTIFSEGLHDTKTWFLERILENGSSEKSMYLHGHPLLTHPKNTLKRAKDILNIMWMPLKKYA